MTTLIIGLLLIFASFLVGLREILLRPTSAHYPRAPFWVRSFMFAWCLGLFFAGAQIVVAGQRPVDWRAMMLVVALTTAMQTAAMTANILRQRYKPKFWARINRLVELVECQPRSPLPLLAMKGFQVARPGEGPEVFAKLDG